MENVNQPIAPEATPTPPPPASSRNRKWPLWVLPAIVILIILSAATYYFANQTPKPAPSPIPTTTPQPTQTPDETVYTDPSADGRSANWKTYTNTIYGYSLLYPDYLKFEKNEWQNIDKTKGHTDMWSKGIDYSIYVYSSEIKGVGPIPFLLEAKHEEKTTVAGISTRKMVSKDETLVHIGPIEFGSYNYLFVYTSGTKESIEGKRVFDQILSTFRFLNETGEGVACTQDVKECPNGSSVGRQPPTCEFAPCP